MLKTHLYRAALSDALFDSCCRHHKVLAQGGFIDIIKNWVPTAVKVAATIGSAMGEFAQDLNKEQVRKSLAKSLEPFPWHWPLKKPQWTWDDRSSQRWPA